jgi:xylitol oxidase
MEVRNWAQNQTFHFERLESPRTAEEALQIIRSSKSIKALGTKHSFNRIAETGATFLSTENLREIGPIDIAAMSVEVGAGVRYGDLCQGLESQGYAIHNLASLPHISVAGACATATHGSGISNPSLASAVVGMTLVTSGEILNLTPVDPEFQGAVVHLGALGLVTGLRLKVQPTFKVRQIIYQNLPLQALEDDLESIATAAYSVSLFTTWLSDSIDQVWLKLRDSEADPGPTFFGAQQAKTKLHPLPDIDPIHCTEQLGEPGPWNERLPHFKMEFTPSSGEELQSEYIVRREDLLAALQALLPLRVEIAAALQVSEIRFVRQDEFWMSPFYQRDSACIHFTWKKDWPLVQPLLPKIEERLSEFNARPHWGKLFAMDRSKIETLYPRIGDFRGLVLKFDPDGKFGNQFLNNAVLASD